MSVIGPRPGLWKGSIFEFRADVREQCKQQKMKVVEGKNWTITFERKKSIFQIDIIVGDVRHMHIACHGSNRITTCKV